MTRDKAARDSLSGSSGDYRRVNASVAMPRSLNAVQISWTYTFKPPLALLPRDAVGEVCMEMTAIRGAARPVTGPVSSATVRRSRVKPASGNAAEAGAGDRRARTHNW